MLDNEHYEIRDKEQLQDAHKARVVPEPRAAKSHGLAVSLQVFALTSRSHGWS
jgi:hypothetical protein